MITSREKHFIAMLESNLHDALAKLTDEDVMKQGHEEVSAILADITKDYAKDLRAAE